MIYRGVPLSEYKVLSDSISKLLKRKRLTAAEIKESLATEFDIPAVLYYMCDQGLLVRSEPQSGWQHRDYRYAIFSEVFPDIELGALEEREARVGHSQRMDARFLLWKATSDSEHLEEAKRLLDHLVEHAPEECRESMLQNVWPNREIMEAWAERGGKAEREGEAS